MGRRARAAEGACRRPRLSASCRRDCRGSASGVTEHIEMIGQALEAVRAVALRLGIRCNDPMVLHHSEHVVVRLYPSDVVARVLPAGQGGSELDLCRELAVARHLVRKGAPAVGPIADAAAGPHFHGDYALTLWPYVEHVTADADNRQHMACAAVALRCIHDALADFPGPLPAFTTNVERCHRLLADAAALPALAATDRHFLRTAYDHIMMRLDGLRIDRVPIHGDAGAHNVFMTPAGALYADFSDVCRGPREWDIGCLPDIDWAPFAPIDYGLLSVLSDLRSLCVSVWCWDKYDMPEKREAAEYHLQYLRERFA